jgi:acyl-CoA thioester hydrolase
MAIERSLAIGDVFEIDLPMRWADADMQRHLNNAMYFRFMEEGRIHMLRAAGIRPSENANTVVAHCACDFIKPILYPAMLRVRHIVQRIGRSSLTHQVDLLVLDDLAFGPYARGCSVMVWADQVLNKAVPWPSDTMMRLGAVVKPAET